MESAADLEWCQCAVCGLDYQFEMPRQLVDAMNAGELIVFAGAGISTENSAVLQDTFYESVKAELGDLLGTCDSPTFPELMSLYEQERGRPELVRRIKKHIDYVRSFPSIDQHASAFHRELATVFPVTDVVTTNWDEYFERFSGAQPFVTDEDWPYKDSSRRRVFKIHGSVANPGSLVATTEDYERRQQEFGEGLIGARLKELLSTKTVVFVGYSLTDPDFVALYRVIRRRMGALLPKAYLVSPEDKHPQQDLQNVSRIRTSGVHFLRELKTYLPGECFIPDNRLLSLELLRPLVLAAHQEVVSSGDMCDDPAMLICACYQDGVLDAFDYIGANMKTGKFSHTCEVMGVARLYDKLGDEREDIGQWHTAAYIRGYGAGLVCAVCPEDVREAMPRYFAFGAEQDLSTFDEYQQAAASFEKRAPDAFAYAQGIARRLGPGIVFQHRPELALPAMGDQPG